MSAAPITLTLPWTCVLHDNHRLMPVVVKGRARLIQTPEYRTTKKAAELRFVQQWKRHPQILGDVRLLARVFMPDRRKRDAGNYRKLITDALTGIAYTDDAQLASETWDRAGIDKENPRVEITISPLLQPVET